MIHRICVFCGSNTGSGKGYAEAARELEAVDSGVRSMVYRTDVFEELGLQAPKSLDELTATAKKIQISRPETPGL
mgnify:CR=1 FL=1